jgi:hypothetical protein
MSLDPVVALTLCWSLALLFAAAAWHKLRDWRGFLGAVARYRLLPGTLVTVVAAAVCLAELAVAAGLAMQAPGAAAAAAGLLTGYALAMAATLRRGHRLPDCGCGGRAQPLSWALVGRNGILAAVSLAALIPVSERTLGWLDGFTAVAGVAVVAVLYGAIDALVAVGARLGEAG